uniref:Uncharacterized protein n=1 Tax=Oryza meridionalis TaxID=40149 RepID=A0A0E0FB28_9ORYZ
MTPPRSSSPRAMTPPWSAPDGVDSATHSAFSSLLLAPHLPVAMPPPNTHIGEIKTFPILTGHYPSVPHAANPSEAETEAATTWPCAGAAAATTESSPPPCGLSPHPRGSRCPRRHLLLPPPEPASSPPPRSEPISTPSAAAPAADGLVDLSSLSAVKFHPDPEQKLDIELRADQFTCQRYVTEPALQGNGMMFIFEVTTNIYGCRL